MSNEEPPFGADDFELEAEAFWTRAFAGVHRADADWEGLFGGDITVWRAGGSFEQQRNRLRLAGVLGYTDMAIDYFDPILGFSSMRDESNVEGSIEVAWKSSTNLEWSGTLRAYDGYPDYRSVWIAEYYRLLFEGFPGYRNPDPKGWAFTGGATWDLDPGITQISFQGGFGIDDIVPAWSFVPPAGLEQTPGSLDTYFFELDWEEAVTGWLKTRTLGRVVKVTDRRPRFQGQLTAAAALSENWTLRGEGGLSFEEPNFKAAYGGLSVDHEFLPKWHWTAAARIYGDTGDIEAAGFNTAAPGLQSYELGVSLRYDRGDFAVRLGGSFYRTDYDSVGPDNQFFTDLYKDRDWWITRLAVTYEF